MTADERVFRFHIEKSKPISVYSADADFASLQTSLQHGSAPFDGLPVSVQVLSPHIWLDRMEDPLETQLRQPAFKPPKQYSIHPKYRAILSVGGGALLMYGGLHVAETSGAARGIWGVVLLGATLVAFGLLELLFERW